MREDVAAGMQACAVGLSVCTRQHIAVRVLTRNAATLIGPGSIMMVQLPTERLPDEQTCAKANIQWTSEISCYNSVALAPSGCFGQMACQERSHHEQTISILPRSHGDL